jgi:hypothetical protein
VGLGVDLAASSAPDARARLAHGIGTTAQSGLWIEKTPKKRGSGPSYAMASFLRALFVQPLRGTIAFMPRYGDLTENMWLALQHLREGQIDLHPRTAQGLVVRKLARKVGITRTGRWICRITATSEEYGKYNPRRS